MSSAGNLSIKLKFLIKLYFMFIMAKTQACSCTPNPDVNVKRVERFRRDVSRTFFNDLGSIEVIVRLNRDFSNDRGREMIGDMLSLKYCENTPRGGVNRCNANQIWKNNYL